MMYSTSKKSVLNKFRFSAVVIPLLGLLTVSENANAVSIDDALSVRGGFSVSGVDNVSYDGKGFDAFVPFASFVGPEIYAINSFTGGPGGTKLEFFLLSEVAFYDGHVPELADSLGVKDSGGNFVTAIPGSAGPGFASELIQNPGEQFTLALNSPEGLFTSIDSENMDGAAHIIGLKVTKAGVVNIDKANLFGAALAFNLQVGDIILFMEDLRTFGNFLEGGLATDADFNDMVAVVRQTAIPEPGTLLLLGTGLLAAGRVRRRRA